MVECEFIQIILKRRTPPRFNRYMVECEFGWIYQWCFALGVLIDTWWNVNPEMLKYVLNEAHRFNRYMVECESMCFMPRHFHVI